MIKKILLLIAILGLVGLAGSFLVGKTPTVNPSEEGLGYHSAVCVEATIDGKLERLGCNQNVLTEFGMNATKAGLTGGGGTSNFNYIGLCNATAGCTQPVATDEVVTSEYVAADVSDLERAAGTIAHLGAGNWSYTNTFTAGADNLVTNVTGLYNASTGDNMFAANNFTLVTLQTSDTLAITWYIWVT